VRARLRAFIPGGRRTGLLKIWNEGDNNINIDVPNVMCIYACGIVVSVIFYIHLYSPNMVDN